MPFANRNTLTTKLALLTGVLAAIIVLATGLIFSLTYKYILERDNRNFLVKEGEEIITEQIVFDANHIKYQASSSGESLPDRLRGYNISAVIFDADLNRLGSYGVYKYLSDSGQLFEQIPKDYFAKTISERKPRFSFFTLSTGISYDTYTTFITSGQQLVGVVQFAKESDFNNRVLTLNVTTLTFLLPLVILISWLTNQFIINKSLTPLNELVDHLKKLQPQHILKRIELSSHPTDEITELVDTFNNLLDRVGESLSKQKDFIAHASHELRTPLSQAVSSLDLAIHFQNTSKANDYVCSVKQDLLQLNQILDSLLLLSKLDDPLTPPPPNHHLNLKEIAAKILDLWSSTIHTEHLSVQNNCDPSFFVRLPKEHLHILFSNLISNAVKYTPAHGQITISTSLDQGTLHLSLSNTGPGISPEDQRHIFDKFYRGRSSHTAYGSGLGLALVKRICDLNHLDISLTSSSHLTTFTLTLPASSNSS